MGTKNARKCNNDVKAYTPRSSTTGRRGTKANRARRQNRFRWAQLDEDNAGGAGSFPVKPSADNAGHRPTVASGTIPLESDREKAAHIPVGEACQSCGLGTGAESCAAAHILVGRCRPRAFIGASQFAASTTPFVTYSNKLIIKPPPSHRQTRVPN